MTEQERQQAFVEGLNELTRRYGFQVSAKMESRSLGPVIQIEAQVGLTPIENWQPPDSSEHVAPISGYNGKVPISTEAT